MDDRFTDTLILNTYLFAKKRLANDAEAEELAQEILCAALEGIRRAEHVERASHVVHGTAIEAFHGWYWKLADNRLRVFLRMKYNGAASLDGMPEIAAEGSDPSDGIVSGEEKSALNFALSRLSRIHREILVCVYLREMTVAETAAALAVPEGTVKRRLYDAREQLRRDLSPDAPEIPSVKRSRAMETTGRSAYAPAELWLVGSLAAPNYWEHLNDLMTKQIFVATANRARTIREIADEIGVAPVYFEQKLDYLIRNRFIKETSKGRYLADIVILPEQKQVDFGNEQVKLFEPIVPAIREVILACEDRLCALDYYGNDFPRERLMWLWYVYACDVLSHTMVQLFRDSKPDVPKDNGKDYRFMGRLILPDEKIVYGNPDTIAWSNLHSHFKTPDYRQITYANLYAAAPFADRDKIITDQNVALLMRLRDTPASALTPVEETMAAELIAAGFLERKPDGLHPAMPILPYTVKGQLEQILRSATDGLVLQYVDKIGALGDRMLLPLIRSDLYEEYVNWVMLNAFWPLPSVLYQAMHHPAEYFLEIPDDYQRSALCSAIYYRQ